jgi:hypothetical protein
MAEVVAVAALWLATVLDLRGVWDDQCRTSYRARRKLVVLSRHTASGMAPGHSGPVAAAGGQGPYR